MIPVLVFFILCGVLTSFKVQAGLRDYNRRMFPSMQEKKFVFWPLVFFPALGFCFTQAILFIQSHQ